MTSQPTILDVENVSQDFRAGFWMSRVRVLHSIDLRVPERSVFGFLGPNGAGKTTLIHLIVGLRRPTEGSVKIQGVPSHSREARARIGYLPERPYFYEHLTAEELLHYFGNLSGMKRAEINARIPKVLDTVGIARARKTELSRYSKGMLQRAGIAQAILHNPDFLVLDEPMSGLDPIGRKEMRELITQLASEGKTVFFSTHVIPDVEAVCDQVAVIQKGKLVGCGPIANFLNQGNVSVEIGVAGLSEAAAKEKKLFSSVRTIPEGIKGTLPDQKGLNDALKALLELRATVLWVNPIRPSLEKFFQNDERPQS